MDNSIAQLEEEPGEILEESGGAGVVDTEVDVVGSLTAQRLDEDGNPIIEKQPAGEAVGRGWWASRS